MTSAFPVTRTLAGRTVSGPPVVLIHGFASSATSDWPAEYWADPLAAAGRETVVVHLPGHPGGPKVAEAAEVAAARVVDALAECAGAEEVDVVGYSLGARLAWDLASHPKVSVRRLVLGGLSPREPFAAVDLGAARTAVQGGPSPDDPLTGAIAAMAAAGDADSLLNLVEGLASEPFDPGAGVPRVPTLFLAGRQDVMAHGIEQLVARVPGARLRQVAGDHRGALVGVEFREAVFEFLGAR
ncbi:alpha/beta fold hydrolase [Amycolatopsis echigonensis]|uniref:Alpha/beta fold hydrolase n=1 Tax=Amycolatopsis echigonensis TaxID=2576905 RepID=A0A8E1VWW3_9PSEU|nr:alpha/beta fold hydrolase [Amycolatopsis echigonensis]MBB2499854.1 alpha/beta fold hydrolase [Amycolatopsis echigonensis]